MITLDFETFSEAGYQWIDNKRVSVAKGKPGLKGVGMAVYAAHPTTEVLVLAYDFDDGQGVHVWLPGMAPPIRLFEAIARGVPIEAHNSGFEYLISNLVCVKRHGWPWIYSGSVRCSQAKGLSYGLPFSLANVATVLDSEEQKDTEGDRLITKFCKPRTPTKGDPRRRILPTDDPKDFNKLIAYCIQDVKTEKSISARIPDLNPAELKVFHVDQAINQRGLHIDRKAMNDCIAIVEQAAIKYTLEVQQITGGAVGSVAELDKLKAWLATRGVNTPKLNKDHVAALLVNPGLPDDCRRVLEIRQVLGSSSVKKLYGLSRYIMDDDRVRYLFQYFGAHTGRWTGQGPQPHNFPKGTEGFDVDEALGIIAFRSLDLVENQYGDPLKAVANCLRGLITAAPGSELICSDYSAIEAVVLAYMAGEQWRIDIFESHGLIYEKTASMISGVPFQEFIDYKERTKKHHPLRATLGKIPELASGFGGSVGAWISAIEKAVAESKEKIKFEDFYVDDEFSTAEQKIKFDVDKWRAASPNIVRFWYAVEDAAKDAIRYPGRSFTLRGLVFQVADGILRITLPSGRNMIYQSPRISPYGKYGDEIIYKGVVKSRWVDIATYGGRLTENVIQAIARDILAYGLVNLAKAGYPVVGHTHDETYAEVMAGTGSIDEYETIMSTMPPWCAHWAIRARGGWRGHRYRKD